MPQRELHIHRGMKLREAEAVAFRLGVRVQRPHASGTTMFQHREFTRGRLLLNHRRDDAPAVLVSSLRRLARALGYEVI